MQLTCVATILALGACASGHAMAQYATARGEVVFPDATRVSVEIADTDAKRQQGLMFRESMASTDGMLFIFDRAGFYPFWMKNTLIPLDILWLSPEGQVVSIAHSVPPCRADPCPTYPPDAEALFVVEVVSGFARDHGVRVGDALELRGVPGRE